MTAVFTICANNYLAHAITLANSFKKHHPTIHFTIAIVDKPDDTINYDALPGDEVLWVDKVLEDDFDGLSQKYNIAELCTVFKPMLIKHLFDRNYKEVIYLDPDIKVYSPLNEIFSLFETHDVILTPHICSPTKETATPSDIVLMSTGIFNLGFLAIRESEQVNDFLIWWDKRVKSFGYHNLSKGYFYDQIWMGYTPVFIDKVKILKHLGYNVANWNLHERVISLTGGSYTINGQSAPLRFFHFSHFKMEELPYLASYNQDHSLENRPDLVEIVNEYVSDLMSNRYKHYKGIPHFYGKEKKVRISDKTALRLNRFKTSLYFFKKGVKHLLKG